ncbi:MAG TPA: hypothetical protein DCW90_03275 [Lachnospiraceae bacterium]|nr:hypothetical protein [Lachnospiraceae bacterium]
MEIHSNLAECKKYSENIIPQIIYILDQNSFHFIVDESMSEIIIPDSDTPRDKIQDLIESSLDIPKVITGMLIQVKEAKNKIFIRLVLK